MRTGLLAALMVLGIAGIVRAQSEAQPQLQGPSLVRRNMTAPLVDGSGSRRAASTGDSGANTRIQDNRL